MSSRSISWTIAIVLIIAGLIAATWFGSDEHTIRRDENYIQAQINKSLPKTSHGLTVREVVVHVQDNHVNILAEISGTVKGKSASVVAQAVGVPDYENSRHGDFYFLPETITVEDITYNDEPPGALLSRLADRSHFKIVRNTLNNAADRMERGAVHVAEKGAKTALEHVPVYRLKDEGIGWFLRASVQKVDVEGNQVVVTYSLWHFTQNAIVFTVIMLIGAGFVGLMMACPEAAEIFSLLG